MQSAARNYKVLQTEKNAAMTYISTESNIKTNNCKIRAQAAYAIMWVAGLGTILKKSKKVVEKRKLLRNTKGKNENFPKKDMMQLISNFYK